MRETPRTGRLTHRSTRATQMWRRLHIMILSTAFVVLLVPGVSFAQIAELEAGTGSRRQGLSLSGRVSV